MNYYWSHLRVDFHRPHLLMAKPGSGHYSRTQLPPHNLHASCTSNHVECRLQTLADIPDTTLVLLSDRKCEYISNHNRLKPENVYEENFEFDHSIFFPIFHFLHFHQNRLTYFHIRAAFQDCILSSLIPSRVHLSVVH